MKQRTIEVHSITLYEYKGRTGVTHRSEWVCPGERPSEEEIEKKRTEARIEFLENKLGYRHI